MHKKTVLVLSGILLIPLAIPYFIPLGTSHKIPALPYPDSRFFVTSDGVRIHYRLNQSSINKGKVLLVHGMSSSTFSFRNNIEPLSNAGYQILTVDLPCFGYSDRQRGLVHSQINRSKWLWELIKTIDTQNADHRPWNLVGHSMGASTLLAMSNQKSDHIVSMVMIDGAVALPTPHIPILLDTPIARWLKVYLRYGVFNRKTVERLLSSAYGKKADPEEVEGFLTPMRIDQTASAWVDFIKTAKNVNIWDWKHPSTPLLVLWGEKDTWVNPSVIDEIRKVALNMQVTIFKDQGHCPHMSDPALNDVLIDFLNNHSR
jgi:pimeloyl-ACP methyl ester carboxylesterase